MSQTARLQTWAQTAALKNINSKEKHYLTLLFLHILEVIDQSRRWVIYDRVCVISDSRQKLNVGRTPDRTRKLSYRKDDRAMRPI